MMSGMRYALLAVLLVGCDVPPVKPATAYIDDVTWVSDANAACSEAGVPVRWVDDPGAADLRIRVFAYSSCPTDSTGTPRAAFSCPGGPIHVWPRCGHAAAEIARHLRLRAADGAVERVDYCTRNVDF